MTYKISETDLIGKALVDYLAGEENNKLMVFSDIAEPDEIPVGYFFRKWEDMPEIEQKALELCSGEVLDVGAAAGCHSLVLQKNNIGVTAIDISNGAISVMKTLGVKKVQLQDFFTIKNQKFNTILMLMNGIGICGTLQRLDVFFIKLKEILAPGGQVLLDSSDIMYMFEEEDGSVMIDLNANYYGEVNYQFGYDNQKTEPFDWLFIDFDLLKTFAIKHGFVCKMVFEGSHYDFLAQITLLSI